jgi:hypothetical protein
MSPARRGTPSSDAELVLSRRRRRRRTGRRRGRRGLLVALVALVVLAVAVAAATGAGAFVFASSCDLDSLRQVRIGQNSFVYAADGSLLGRFRPSATASPCRSSG